MGSDFVCVFVSTKLCWCDVCRGTPVSQIAGILSYADAQRLHAAGWASPVPGESAMVRADDYQRDLPRWSVRADAPPSEVAGVSVRIVTTGGDDTPVPISEVPAATLALWR